MPEKAAKKRHLTVLRDDDVALEAPRSAPFLLLIGTASSLVAWVLVATVTNGLLGPTLARSGPVIMGIASLVGLALAGGAGGALVAYQGPKASPWLPRITGTLTALVGWGASFAMSRDAELPYAPGLGSWFGLLGLMIAASAIGAAAAFSITRKQLAKPPAAPPDPT